MRLSLLIVGLLSANGLLAQDLSIQQKILMPGPLAAAHADLESRCENCHTAFTKENMSALCLNCHKPIAKDRLEMTGFHGRSLQGLTGPCDSCHTDHEGRDANILGLLPDTFNHTLTRFPLQGAHQSASCTDCHQPQQKFREASNQCSGCHQQQDIHQGALGNQCGNCHMSTTWLERKLFNHDETQFPLLGQHQQTACSSCHIGQQYQFADKSCHSCHKTDDVHLGTNGADCQNCHRPDGWDQLNFNHNDTDFPLHGKHQTIPCRACHQQGEDASAAPTECHLCHRNDDIHLGRNGDRCEKCHNTSSWKQVQFDHQRDTDFPLTGQHSNLTCTQCHIGGVHDNLPRDCGSCHAADDVHKNSSMSLCATCHSTDSWKAINQFDHDFTAFPLIGMHQIAPCHSCHVGNQFSLSDNQCVSCHLGDDKHGGALGTNCSQCHTPNAWEVWQFDHAKQANYPLDGKHNNLACAACHVPGSDLNQTPTLCGNCHRSQDIHNGEFGARCDRCHSTANFFELLIQQR